MYLSRIQLLQDLAKRVHENYLVYCAIKIDMSECNDLIHQVGKHTKTLSNRDLKTKVNRIDYLLRRMGRIWFNLTHEEFCKVVDGENVVQS